MKRLNTIFLIVIALSFTSVSYSQLELQVIAGSGGYAENTSYSMSYTVGEAVIPTATSASYHLTQGFQQGHIYVLSVNELENPIDISVYPNPARDILNISASENTRMSVYDMQGKLVRTLDIFSSLTSIDVSELSRGTYTLVFEADGVAAERKKIVIQ